MTKQSLHKLKIISSHLMWFLFHVNEFLSALINRINNPFCAIEHKFQWFINRKDPLCE